MLANHVGKSLLGKKYELRDFKHKSGLTNLYPISYLLNNC